MFARLARFLVHRPAPVLLALAVVTAISAVLATQIRFDFSPQTLFAGRDQIAAEAERIRESFDFGDNVLMVLLEATGRADVLASPALTWQVQVAESLRELPQVHGIESIATMRVPRATLQFPPQLTLLRLIREAPVDMEDEARVRRELGRSELVEGTLLSRNRRLTAMMLLLDPQARSLNASREVIAAVNDVIGENPPPPGYRVRFSGVPALRVDVVDGLRNDQTLLLPLAGLLYLVALGLTFRRLSGSLVPLLAVLMGLSWTIAALVLADEPFNIITNILPVLLLIIGISNCVHIVSRYAEEAHHTFGDRKLAAERTIAHMAVACILTLVTTGIGFGSLLVANSQALRGLGWQAAIGLGFLYVSIICTHGALIGLFKPPRRGTLTGRDRSPVTASVTAAGYLVATHPKYTTTAILLLIAGSVWAASGVPVNTKVIETYDEDHPTLETMRLVERELGGLLPLDIVLESDDPRRFLDPDMYRKVAELGDFALAQETVLSSRSYVDLYQEIYAQSRRRGELAAELPQAGEEGTRRIEQTARIVQRLEEVLHPGAFLTADARMAKIHLRVGDVGSRRIIELVSRLEAKIEELFPPGSGVRATLTGDAYMNAVAMDAVIRDLLYSLLGAVVIIFGLIAVLFRSVRVGLLSALPNLMPLIVTAGYMGVRGYDMNVGNVIVFTISLGIAVDDTIHFLFRFREEARMHHDVRRAAYRACHGAGPAVVRTSAMIVAGLSVLLLSEFVPTRRFAELTSVTMIAALAGDLLLLPACLVLFWKGWSPPEPGHQEFPGEESTVAPRAT